MFFPNPVPVPAGRVATDQKDADFFSADPFLATAYKPVTLTDLDGVGHLTGTYAKVILETGRPPARRPGGFSYTRDTTSSSR